MRITEFATANIWLVLGLNSGLWMTRSLLKIKSLALLTQITSLPTPNLSLDVMVETYMDRLDQ